MSTDSEAAYDDMPAYLYLVHIAYRLLLHLHNAVGLLVIMETTAACYLIFATPYRIGFQPYPHLL